MIEYIHNVPERLRVKIPEIRNRLQTENEVLFPLNDLDGVDTISVNHLTGSVTIKYDPELMHPWEILGKMKQNEAFSAIHSETINHSTGEVNTKAGHAIGKAVCSWAVGKAFENSALSLLAAFI